MFGTKTLNKRIEIGPDFITKQNSIFILGWVVKFKLFASQNEHIGVSTL